MSLVAAALAGLSPATAQDLGWLSRPPAAASVPGEPGNIIRKAGALDRPPGVPAPAMTPEARAELIRRIVDPSGRLVIVKGDTRQRIEGTYQRALPASAVTHILVKYRGSAQGYQGSGFLIAPDMVITAAHVLWSPEHGPAEDLIVTPGCFGATIEQGPDLRSAQRVGSDRIRTHEAWGRPEHLVDNDYGAILLADGQKFRACGTFVLQAVGNTFLAGLRDNASGRLLVSGFPIDKDLGRRQWLGRGGVLSFAAGRINHLIDTEQGQSGSPLLDIGTDVATNARVPVAIGVHSRGAREGTHNIAARVDGEFLRRVETWKRDLARLNAPRN